MLGIADARLSIVMTQLITVGGTKMKKADGHYVTLKEILDQVGGDAIRYFLISRASGSTIDFDLDLATKAGNENPVYYVQMAHARCAGVFRQAELEGIPLSTPDLGLLGREESASSSCSSTFPTWCAAWPATSSRTGSPSTHTPSRRPGIATTTTIASSTPARRRRAPPGCILQPRCASHWHARLGSWACRRPTGCSCDRPYFAGPAPFV